MKKGEKAMVTCSTAFCQDLGLADAEEAPWLGLLKYL